MRLQRVEKIKRNISIQASKKSTNLLEGLYKSVFQGKSMDFDDLRDYVIGDNNKDIDWKSSIRHGSLLVRRYCAYRRHNFVFIIDSGKKFTVTSQEVTGIGSTGELTSYAMPSSSLYMIKLDDASVAKASQAIKDVMEGK